MSDKDLLTFRYWFDINPKDIQLATRRIYPPAYVIRAGMNLNDAWVNYIVGITEIEPYLLAMKEYQEAMNRWRNEKIQEKIKK